MIGMHGLKDPSCSEIARGARGFVNGDLTYNEKINLRVQYLNEFKNYGFAPKYLTAGQCDSSLISRLNSPLFLSEAGITCGFDFQDYLIDVDLAICKFYFKQLKSRF